MTKKEAQLAKMVRPTMPSNEYHAHSAISAGSLDTIHTDGVPALIYKLNNPKKPTPDMVLGTLTHTLTLEPDQFGKQYIMIPKLNYKLKKNQELKKELEDRAFQENLVLISQEQYDHALAMSKSVLAHPLVRKIMKKGRPEVTYFWEKDGQKLKARPDWVNGKYWMDLKTARNARKTGFASACKEGGYHRRASFYTECAKYHGEDVDYVFVLVNKTPPYQVGLYLLPPEALDIGKTQWEKALEDYQNYDPADAVYGFSRIIEPVPVPDWALN